MLRVPMVALVLVAALGASGPAGAQEDPRQPVKLAPDIRAELRAEMREHMNSLDDVMGALATGDLKAAAREAEAKMGFGTGKGLGRFMPEEFRQMGQSMHRTALEFARVARETPPNPGAGDWRTVVGALQAVTTHCRSCHASFRIE